MKQVDDIICTHDDFVIPFEDVSIVQEDGCLLAVSKTDGYCHRYENTDDLKAASSPWYVVEKGNPGVNALSLKESDFPVSVRNAKEGDVIQMRFGRKKVHRFFIDRHIPKWRRKQWPVVENAEGKVIFVAGLGCDVDHYTVKPDVNVLSLFHYTKD